MTRKTFFKYVIAFLASIVVSYSYAQRELPISTGTPGNPFGTTAGSRALAAVEAAIANGFTLVPGDIILAVYSDQYKSTIKITSNGTGGIQYGEDQGSLISTKFPTASGGAGAPACVQTITINGDYFTTTTTQGGQVIGSVTEFIGNSITTSGCDFL